MDDWEFGYDEHAGFAGGDPEHVLASIAGSGVTDLFVLAHGWNTDRAGAQDLYAALVPLVRAAVAAAGPGTVGVPGFARVFWPSVWFPETPAVVPSGAGSAHGSGGAVTEPEAGTAALTGTEIADAVAAGFGGAAAERVRTAGALIDEGLAATGETDAQRRERLERVHGIVADLAAAATGIAPEDSGELALLLTDHPRRDYPRLAEVLGTVPPGSSTQGLGDLIGTALQGAKDALRLLSYSTMKARAGTVGQHGLGPHLARLHELAPGVRAHLVGHSFGARLVSYALAGVGAPAASPVGSVLLVQGAFSHYAFSAAVDNPFGSPGSLHGLGDRVHGILGATHSVHDRALGTWYPKMSFLTQDGLAADGGVDRWGAVGANGFQAVAPHAARVLHPDGTLDATLPTTGLVSVAADAVIDDVDQSAFAGAHSDIRHAALARLAVAIAGVPAAGPVPTP